MTEKRKEPDHTPKDSARNKPRYLPEDAEDPDDPFDIFGIDGKTGRLPKGKKPRRTAGPPLLDSVSCRMLWTLVLVLVFSLLCLASLMLL